MPEVVPTERELQALKVLWQLGQATVREICDAIGEQGDRLAYTTVLSLLQVMEQKGLVGHTAAGKVYTYFPRVRRESTFRRLAKGFLETVFDGAMEEYVMRALESRPLSANEISRLEQMIAAAKTQTRGSPPEPNANEPRARRNRKQGDKP
ncbi:MAG: BlaI/MecI/CopY family transcriptional regulator [Planctomycetia bacterium]|nr:BlaI/MecI/CopY family transcriptional regulator [Planctomycetia bacterium]